jgi:hypothetical protein
LTRLRDEELSYKIRDLKIFEHLHNEKPSPLFLTLIKSSKDEDLHCIKDDNGADFASDELREEHIVNHFAKIY